jgi:hypothetical protein
VYVSPEKKQISDSAASCAHSRSSPVSWLKGRDRVNLSRSFSFVEPGDSLFHSMAEPVVETLVPTDAVKVVADVPMDENIAYECNICLELAKEPVVTLCGHLYCWPCLYR